MQSFQILLALPIALGLSACAATYEVAQRDSQASDTGAGAAELPWKTISHAAENISPGDRVIIRGGIYRERVLIKISGTAENPIRFEVAPGEQVILTGADRLTGWEKADPDRPIYRVRWPHRFNAFSKTMTHPSDEYHRLIGRCEQVIVDGYLLRQVLDRNQLAPGTFFADVTNQTLFVWDSANRDLNKVFVEASARQEIFRVEGNYVQLRGLNFRYAANAAQHGAVVLAGRHDRIEDCAMESMNSSGASFSGEDIVVRRCLFRDNGQLGFSANHAHRLLFTDNLVENNNTKNFDRQWEAGGNKLVLTRDAVLEHSRFVRNRGHGIWFDIGNENCTVRNCLIADNEDSGIFYEISFGLRAHDNVILGNGFAETSGGWGARAGISISSSPDCVIERNLIFGNREGFNFREQSRTTPLIGDRTSHPIWNHDENIRNNLIVHNRDAQVWGWFDMKDNRHWPAGKPANDSSAGSPGLSLEKLHLRFADNIYFAAPGQGWFNWGVTWGRHKNYKTVEEFRTDLGIDSGSESLTPAFADPRARDFRLKPAAMAGLKQNYPQGMVPGALLGESR